jgi:hypothetical protein
MRSVEPLRDVAFESTARGSYGVSLGRCYRARPWQRLFFVRGLKYARDPCLQCQAKHIVRCVDQTRLAAEADAPMMIYLPNAVTGSETHSHQEHSRGADAVHRHQKWITP